MTSLLFSLLVSFTAAAHPPLEFITGFRKRPVRVTVTDLDPPSSDYIDELTILTQGRDHVDSLVRRIDACEKIGTSCDLRLRVGDWSELFTLGTLLALQNDPSFNWGVPSLYSVKGLFGALFPVVGLSADDLARQAVEPFRNNWLYSSSDAAVLNEMERHLAVAWAANVAWGVVTQKTIFWTGNPTGNVSELLKRMDGPPVIFGPLTEEDRRKVDAIRAKRRACAPVLDPRFGNSGLKHQP